MYEKKEDKHYTTFDEWYEILRGFAIERNMKFLIPEKKDYPTDGFNMGNTPREELVDIISYSID